MLAKTIVEGLLTLIATAGAIAALVAGVGPLAATLGEFAVGNLATIIEDAITTNKLAA